MEELNGARPVLRIRRDADGDGRLQLGLGGSTREAGSCHGAAQALGDLQCLVRDSCRAAARRTLPRRSGRERLCERSCSWRTPPTPRRTSSPARWPWALLISRRRSRSASRTDSGACAAFASSQLAIDRELEVLRVEEPCLGIAPRLMLEQRNLEPLSKQQQWRDCERSEPRVRQADGRQRCSRRSEQRFGADAERRSARQVVRVSDEPRRSWSVVTKAAHAAMSRERPGRFPVEEHRRECVRGRGGDPRGDRGHDLRRQFERAGETRSAWPHDPARYRDDERQRDEKVERKQDRSGRQDDDRRAVPGTARSARAMKACADTPSSARPMNRAQLLGRCSSCKGREEPRRLAGTPAAAAGSPTRRAG